MNLETPMPAVGRSRWTGLGAFIGTELRVQLHEGLAIATSIVVQAVFLVFVAVLAQGYLPFTLVGAIVFSVFTIGQRIQNEAAWIRIDHKLHELYHASPMTPGAYFLGLSVGVLLAYVGPILVLVAAAVYFIAFTAAAALVLVAVLAAEFIFTASVGYMISTWFRDMRSIWPYSTLFFNLFGVLPPVFYPLGLFPVSLQPVALLLPTSGGTALAERAAGILPLTTGEILLASISLVVSTGAAFIGAVYWARRISRER
ncbi:MAG: ABC transporter permease [Thermoplasmata archaeon]|nr:ABC transporter permease [Thermoplasmata archaeon]